MTPSVPVTMPAPVTMPVRRAGVYVAVAGLVAGTGHTGDGAFANIPIQLYLKDRAHLTPLAMATFFAIAGVPWYLKPLGSLVSDAVSLRGSRRKAWIFIGAMAATFAWLVIGRAPRTWLVLLAAAIVIETGVMLGSAVLGAVLVESGRQHGATGRFTSLRMSAVYVGGLVAGPVGGWLATHALGLTASVGIALQGVLVIAALTCIVEPKERGGEPRAQWRSLWRVMRSRDVLQPMALGFLVLTAPGFGTPLFYFQTDVLGHSPGYVGLTRLTNALAASLAAIGYWRLSSGARLRSLLVAGAFAHGVAALLFLRLGSGGVGPLLIFALYGACSALVLLALWDLAARVAPVGYEGLGYALMMSALNAAQTGSDLLGSFLHDRWSVSFRGLVLVNTCTSLLVIPLVARLRSAILDRTERDVMG